MLVINKFAWCNIQIIEFEDYSILIERLNIA